MNDRPFVGAVAQKLMRLAATMSMDTGASALAPYEGDNVMSWRNVLVSIVIVANACSLPPPQIRAAQAEPLVHSIEQFRQQMLIMVNQVRSANGRGVLALSPKLNTAAQGHAEDIATRGTLSHAGADGSNSGDRALRAGYSYREIAENVAQGQVSADQAMASWMNSPGHRTNILLPDVHDLGVGYAEGKAIGTVPGNYWVIVLGRR